MLQARLLTSARAVLLSAEEAETERRMTRDAEMKARSSNNVLCSLTPSSLWLPTYLLLLSSFLMEHLNMSEGDDRG